MSCPTNEQWDLLSMNLLDEAAADPLRRHLAQCPRCRERFERACREDAALRECHAAFNQAHDARREQLLIALADVTAHSPKPGRVRRRLLRFGETLMQFNTTANRRAALLLAPAACVVLAVSLFWGWGGLSAFGEAIRRFREADTIFCQVTIEVATEMRQPDGTVVQKLDHHRTEELYISAYHGVRRDAYEDGQLVSTTFDPAGADTVVVDHRQQRYFDFGAVEQSEAAAEMQHSLRDMLAERGLPELQFFGLSHDTDRFIQGLRQLTSEADRELGTAEIDGVEVIGFEIAGEKIGFAPPVAEPTEENRAELWVGAEKNLPLKLVTRFTTKVGQIQDLPLSASFHLTATYDAFEFNVPMEADWFEVIIPEGYEPANDVQTPFAEVPSEARLIEALDVFAEHAGRYPSTLQPTNITFEVSYLMGALQAKQLRAKRKGNAANDLPKPEEIGPKFEGLMYFAVLQAEGRNPEYYGSEVKPDEADAVLLRWTLDDGRTRVIYGNLDAETAE
jgi:hypothetical protein